MPVNCLRTNSTSVMSPPAQVAQPTAFYSTSPLFPNDPVLTPVASCPTPGTDACIQLRLDAVGFAVNQLFITANNVAAIPSQFRIGLYPYINSLYSTYFPLTSSINGSPNTPGTINYAAANLASLLDTNTNANLGSGGTNQDAALSAMNNLIINVGNGSAFNNTLPYVFIITDGAVTTSDQRCSEWKLVRQQPRHNHSHPRPELHESQKSGDQASQSCTSPFSRSIP